MSEPRRISYRLLSSIAAAPRNVKKHDIEELTLSIQRFGFNDAVIVDGRTGKLVSGHGRVEALRAMHLADPQRHPAGVRVKGEGAQPEWLVPVQDGWSSKNDTEAEAFLVAANRIVELGGWDQVNLADVFEAHDRFPLDVWRLELLELIRRTPHLDWLLLTKRPQNIRRMLMGAHGMFERTPDVSMGTVDMIEAWHDGKPPHNIWLGTTVEDQTRADLRIPHLLAMPAALRFLSCEPLLERVNLRLREAARTLVTKQPVARGLDWVIIGGESGAKARPFDLAWARDLVRQARQAGAAPFVKQMGQRPVITDEREHLIDAPLKLADLHGGDPAEWPEDLRVREFPS